MEQQDEQDEIVQEFLSESFEGLDQLDRELVELEEEATRRHVWHPSSARSTA